MKPKLTTIKIREDTKNILKAEAAEKGISLQEYLEEIIGRRANKKRISIKET